MKNQDIFPSEQIKEFLLPLAENAYKNFIAGVDSIGKILWKEEQKGFEEGGVFVQEESTAKRGSQEA